MRGLSPAHTGEDPARDVYFEFNFFDGVMVDCKEVNSAEWGPWQSHRNLSHKIWNASGLEGKLGFENLKIRREVKDFSPSNFELKSSMEGRHEWRREKQKSPKGDVKIDETVNAAIGLQGRNNGDSSLSCSISTGACPMDCISSRNKDTPYRKKVQFLSSEHNIPWNQQSCFQNSTHHHTSDPLTRNSFGSTPKFDSRDDFHQQGLHGVSQQVPCVKYHGDDYVARDPQHMACIKYHCEDYAARDSVSLSTGHLDWLWSEEPERQDTSLAFQNEHRPFSACSSTSMVAESSELCHRMGEVLSPGDRVKINSRQSWKDPGNDPGKSALGALAAVVGTDSPRCSSMSLTDLVETTSPKNGPRNLVHRERSTLASYLQLAGSALAGQFHSELSKETDIDPALLFSPMHSSPSSNSTSKRDSTGLKSEPRILSISEPTPDGIIHGLLHCTLREGLPNYTFLLDDYDEVVTAKIWMEDIILGEDQGAWRYTFYSLRGDSKKKGKSGWKHWRRKEKLASVFVGKMRVSSVLCTEPGHDGEVNVSVESEFVLSIARAQEPSILSQADFSSQTSLSSLETAPHGCSKASYTPINNSSSPSQSRASSSDGGHSDVPSPGAISAWYVSQSLIPSSLASPDAVTEGRQKYRKWSLHTGVSGIRISKAKRKNQQSPSLIGPNSNFNTEESSSDVTWNQNQPQSELAAMIINVPLEIQDQRVLAELMPKKVVGMNHGIMNQMGQLGLEEHRTWDEATECEIHRHGDHIHHTKHKIHEQHRQANITVILPSGNHGRPLSDSKGPSPLIKRWKEGGKCDCKGWDLGCGLMVLSNQQPKMHGIESKASKLREYQGQGKPLTLYKQETDQEEAYLSLAPQENGLIALDFRAPLSPLQAFAMAVAILHGRGSGVPDVDTSHNMPTAANPEVYVQEEISLNQNLGVGEEDVDGSNLGVMNWREGEGKRMAGHVQSSMFSNQGMSPVNDSLGGAYVKVQGSDVLNCASELALSFERV